MNRMLLVAICLMAVSALQAQREAEPTHEWILRKYAKLDLNENQAARMAVLEDSLNQLTISLWEKAEHLIRGSRPILTPEQWGQLMGMQKGMLGYYEGIMRKKEPEYQQRLKLQEAKNEWLTDGYQRKLQRLQRKVNRKLTEEDKALRDSLRQLYFKRVQHFERWADTRCTKPDGTVICPLRRSYFAAQQSWFENCPDLCLYYCYRLPGASEDEKEALYSGLEELRDIYFKQGSRLERKLQKLTVRREEAMQEIKKAMNVPRMENMVMLAPTVREQELIPVFPVLLLN